MKLYYARFLSFIKVRSVRLPAWLVSSIKPSLVQGHSPERGEGRGGGGTDIDSLSNLRDGPRLDPVPAGSRVRLSYNRHRRHLNPLF